MRLGAWRESVRDLQAIMLHILRDHRSDVDDLIMIREALETLHGYRRAIAFTFVLSAVLALSVGLFMYFRAPIERVGTTRFRLLFDSASQSRYPTGAPFSPSDITAEPILRQAYRSNDLRRFADYDTFRSSVFVHLAGPPNPSGLSLTMHWTERVATLPSELMQKIVTEVLVLWAQDTIAMEHATRSDIAILAKEPAALEAIEREDYLAGAEILQSHMSRAKRALERLETLPGGQAIRAGTHQRSLTDVRTQLEDVAEPAITALLDLVRAEGVSKNAVALRGYANSRLYHLRVDEEASTQRVTALQEALVAYSNDMTPNADQSFLKQLLKLSNAGAVDAYRRRLLDRIISESQRAATLKSQAAYYREVSKVSVGGAHAIGSPEAQALATAHINTALNTVKDSVEHLRAIYKEFSEGELGVPGVYAVTAPFSMTVTRAVSLRTVALFVVLTLVLSAILVPAACLLHAALRHGTLARA